MYLNHPIWIASLHRRWNMPYWLTDITSVMVTPFSPIFFLPIRFQTNFVDMFEVHLLIHSGIHSYSCCRFSMRLILGWLLPIAFLVQRSSYKKHIQEMNFNVSFVLFTNYFNSTCTYRNIHRCTSTHDTMSKHEHFNFYNHF